MNTGNTLIIDAFWVSNTPFPTVQDIHSKEGQLFHKHYSGNARYLGWMDLVLLKDIIQKHNITHIILQNMEALGEIAEFTNGVKVCTAHEHNRFIVRTVTQEKEFLHSKPIYDNYAVLGGWKFSKDDDVFPVRAQNYMLYLLVHTHVNSITCMNDKIKVTAHWNESNRAVFNIEPNL